MLDITEVMSLVLDFWIGEGPLNIFAMGARSAMGMHVILPVLWRAQEAGNWQIPLSTTPPPYMEDDNDEGNVDL